MGSHALQADYDTDVKKATELYRAGQLEESLIYFKQAQQEKPNPQLEAFILKVETHLEKQRANTIVPVVKQQQAVTKQEKQSSSWPKWVLLGADVALVGWRDVRGDLSERRCNRLRYSPRRARQYHCAEL